MNRARIAALVVASALSTTSCAAPAGESAAPVVVQVAPPDRAAALATNGPGDTAPPPSDASPAAGDAYVSGVSLGKQHPLGPANVAFAVYLNAVHNRLHPLFADLYLTWLDARAKTDPQMDGRLVVRVEFAVAPDGRIAQIGVVRSSGVAGFDAAGIYAFSHAAPFGPTPPETRSADGNLWVQWDLHRDPMVACSTIGARPFLLGP